MKRKKQKKDAYQEVTDNIIAYLEEGVKPWNRPWNAPKNALGMPQNVATENFYNGINVVLLLSDPKAMETGDPRWCTYKQAEKNDWQVRKGEKSTTVYYFTMVEREPRNKEEEAQTVESEKEPGKQVIRYPAMMRHRVFHATQIDGIPAYQIPPSDPNFKPIEEIETLVKNTGVFVQHMGNTAFYSPSGDYINLPNQSYFLNEEGYGKTKLHEIGHWSAGDKKRVPRPLRSLKGSASYAFEELIAELASAFMFARLGVANDVDYDSIREPHTGLENTAAYLESWVKVLKEDSRAIVRAASTAQKVADFCLKFSPKIAGDNVLQWEPAKPKSHVQKIILGKDTQTTFNYDTSEKLKKRKASYREQVEEQRKDSKLDIQDRFDF